MERGETIVITRHGRPIARLVPESGRQQEAIDSALRDIADLRRRSRGMTVQEILAAKNEGRPAGTAPANVSLHSNAALIGC